jgi:two-component system CheB/CheR fusion protein
VQTTDGAWYLMRIRPYRTLENVIEGAVVTFVDITGRKKAETALGESRELAESIVATVREPLLLLNGDLRVVRANQAFYSAFESSREDTEGRSVYELCDRQWDVPDFRKLLEEIIPQRSSFDGYEMSLSIAGEGPRKVMLNARNVYRKGDREALVLLAMEYIGGRSFEKHNGPLNDGTEPPRSEEDEGAEK